MAKSSTQKRWHSDYNILFNRAAPKLCMAGFDCRAAAKCHSISERRVLRKLAENGKVIAVRPSEYIPGAATLGLQGVGQVSTFSGFCSMHDQRLFARIDNFDYQLGDAEQEYLFAYRTIARYHYFKLAWRYGQEAKLAALEDVRAKGERLRSMVGETSRLLTDAEVEQLVQFHQQATSDAVSSSFEVRDLMGALNAALGSGDYGAIATRVIELPNEYPIAQSSSLILDDAGLAGYPHMITVTVIPQQGRTYVLLSCTAQHGTSCIDGHLERFRVNGEIDYCAATTHIICMSGDAIAIKPSYWEAVPDDVRVSFVDRLNTWMSGGVDPVQPDGSFNILRDSIL